MSAPDRRERFTWTPDMLERVEGTVEVEHGWTPDQPIDLRHCRVVPGPDPTCSIHGLECAELWGELEDGRVDQLLEERFYDVGLDDNDGFSWSDPDR